MNKKYLTPLKYWLQDYTGEVPLLFLVGGTVRDMLLHRDSMDPDIVCKGAKEFSFALAGRKGATVVPMEKRPDNPCYRVVDNKENHYIDIAELQGETIYDDLQRRDFTINAIAIEIKKDGSSGALIDPLHGARDLNNRQIKMVCEDSFSADPLRILRAFRFAATLSFEIESSTLEKIKDQAILLHEAAPERIWTELLRILETPEGACYFRQMDLIGVLEVIFPEINPMKGCLQNSIHHRDVWEHSLLVMKNCEIILNNLSGYFKEWSNEVAMNLAQNNRRPLLKLTALLHDVGKPSTRNTRQDNGDITFYNHDAEGARLAEIIADRLKMSKKDKKILTLLIAEHLHVLSLANQKVRTTTRIRWFRKMRDDAIPSIILGMADIKGTLGINSSTEYRENYIRWSIEAVQHYYEVLKKRFETQGLISGKDLLALGMEPGPKVGDILAQIRYAQDRGEIGSREEALAMAQKLSKNYSSL